jgi:Tfp pilus assembly protein PilO
LALGTAVFAAVGTWAWREFQHQASLYRSYRDLQLNAGKADSLSVVYAALVKDLEALKEALPAQNQGSHVLNLLVETARQKELGIAGINALDEIPFPGYTELPFELNLTGRFVDLVRYLNAFESRGMAVEVRRLAVKSEAMNKSRLQTRIELSVFVPAGSRGAPAAPRVDTSHAPVTPPADTAATGAP